MRKNEQAGTHRQGLAHADDETMSMLTERPIREVLVDLRRLVREAAGHPDLAEDAEAGIEDMLRELLSRTRDRHEGKP